MNDLVFVHQLSSRQLVPGSVIALTPYAYQDCLDAGLHPSVLDDHIDRRRRVGELAGYLRRQRDWLARLDEVVDAGRGAVRAAAYLLATPVDSVVWMARALRETLINLRPSCVAFMGVARAEEPQPSMDHVLQFHPLTGDTPLAAKLLPLIAADLGIAFEMRAPVDVDDSSSSRIVRERSLPRRARRALGRIRNYWGAPRGASDQPAALMLWEAGYGLRELVGAERRAGRRVLLLERNQSVTHLLEPRPWGFAKCGKSIPVAPSGRRSPLSTAVRSLLAEIDEWAGTPGAHELLQTRMQMFAGQICPVIRQAAAQLAGELAAQGVRRIVGANPGSIEEAAVLVAAEKAGINDRVLIQHGDHAFPYDFWLLTETQTFETLVASDPTMPQAMSDASERLNAPAPRTIGGSPRVADLRRRATMRKRPVLEPAPICYVPTFFMGDSYRCGGSYFEDAWYWRWQTRLLDLMEELSDLTFIWKALPQANQALDPMPSLLDRRAVRNVKYVATPFREAASRVGRVLVDYPSTALYEAVHLGNPVLSIWFKRFADVRDEAVELFRPCLVGCDDEREALELIKTYLRSDAKRYIVPPERLLNTTSETVE